GSRWRRSSPGHYVPAGVSDDLPEQRILEMSLLLSGTGAVTGWAALRLHRSTFHDGLVRDGRTRLPVPLIDPHTRRRPRDGVRWLQDRLTEDEVVIRQGVRVTSPERATFDAMRLVDDVREAVVALDMAVAAELTSVRRMRAYVTRHPGWVGVPQAREALDLADEHRWSPNETRMGLIWELDAGLPRPLFNREVFSLDGRLLGVADLLDVEAGAVGEYDGGDHAGARRRSGDATREGGLRDHGLEVFRVTGFDLRDPAAVVRRMHATRQRALRNPRPRTWTITPPPGWETAPSLDDVLDHRDFLRECEEAWDREQAQSGPEDRFPDEKRSIRPE
ncbi:MAG: hypothetical protein ACXWDI_15890, partial [Nocardioides sp.]